MASYAQFVEELTAYGRESMGVYVVGMVMRQMLDTRTPEKEAAWFDQLDGNRQEQLAGIAEKYKPATRYTQQLADAESQIRYPGIWRAMQDRGISAEEVADRMGMKPESFVRYMTLPHKPGRGLKAGHLVTLSEVLRTDITRLLLSGGVD